MFANPLSTSHPKALMAKLPPTLVVSAEDDQWEDVMQLNRSMIKYAAQLEAAGVTVRFRSYHGEPKRPHVRFPHVFLCTDMTGRSIWALGALADCVEWINAAVLHAEDKGPASIVPSCEFDVRPDRLAAIADLTGERMAGIVEAISQHELKHSKNGI